MNHVLQINSAVPLTRVNFPDKHLYKYLHNLLDKNNVCVTDEERSKLMVPVSIICYSRKAVGESADKLLAIDNYCKDDTLFVCSKPKKSTPPKEYDISLLRQCLKIAIKDHQSSRNVMATYETNSHINHRVQKQIITNYETKQRNLAKLYFGPEDPGCDEDTGEIRDYKYVDKDFDLDNANAHYLRECLNQRKRNVFADRKDDYDKFREKVMKLEDNDEELSQELVTEFNDLVERWYYHMKSQNGKKYDPAKYQTQRSTDIKEECHHNPHCYYPYPKLQTKTNKGLRATISDMFVFFHDFTVFISLLNYDEYGEKGIFGKVVENSFYRGMHGLHKNFNLGLWYKFCSSDNEENRVENFDTLLIDPTETYQGPKLLMPAGWDKMVSSIKVLRKFIVYFQNN